MRESFFASVLVLLTLACRPAGPSLAEQTAHRLPPGIQSLSAPVHGYRVVATYPHDPEAFTQGLLYHDGYLYESTGRRGRSTIRKVELETGKVLQSRAAPDQYFAEGLAWLGDRFYQLTWQAGVAMRYTTDLEADGQLIYPGEGWGLTTDGSALIFSDGGPSLSWRDPKNLRELRRLLVKDGEQKVNALNELEVVEGEILANVWLTAYIARIDPDSGKVNGWIDLGGILPPDRRRGADVLNGIAYDEQGKRLFVTGKLWPCLFEIEVIER